MQRRLVQHDPGCERCRFESDLQEVARAIGSCTPDMATLAEKVRLAQARGHGVIHFYWEGLRELHAGPTAAPTGAREYNPWNHGDPSHQYWSTT